MKNHIAIYVWMIYGADPRHGWLHCGVIYILLLLLAGGIYHFLNHIIIMIASSCDIYFMNSYFMTSCCMLFFLLSRSYYVGTVCVVCVYLAVWHLLGRIFNTSRNSYS